MTFQLCLPGKGNINGEKKERETTSKARKKNSTVEEMINTCQVCHYPCQKNGLEI